MPERFHVKLLIIALSVAIIGSVIVAVSRGSLFMAIPYGVVAAFIAFGLWLFIIHPQLSREDITLIDHIALGVLLCFGMIVGLALSLTGNGNILVGIGGGAIAGFVAWGFMHIVTYWY